MTMLKKISNILVPLIGALALSACGTNSIDLTSAPNQEEAPLGMVCEQVCETTSVCQEVKTNCREEATNCHWEWNWWSVDYVCDNETVCDSYQDCTATQTNCHQECEKLAYPRAETLPLVNALNYWSTDQIAFNLNLPTETAAAITQKRIDNGGLFFRIRDARIEGFDPEAYKSHPSVESNTERLSMLAPAISYNNEVDLFINGPEVLEMIVNMIDDAEDYVHLNMMLFFNDEGGDAIANALKRAAERGVIVRVMFDHHTTTLASYTADTGAAVAGTPVTPGLGIIDIIEEGCRSPKASICEVRSTSVEATLTDSHWYDEHRPEFAAMGVPESMLIMQDYIQADIEMPLNTVNHQKYMIIDGNNLMIGSSNFGANYLWDGEFEGRDAWVWRDGMARVKGPLAKLAQKLFVQQWVINARGEYFDYNSDFYFGDDESLMTDDGNTTMALMLSFPGNPQALNMRYIDELLRNSQGDVLIENPYVTDSVLWDSLSSLDPEHASNVHMLTSIALSDSPTNGATIRCRGLDPVSNGVNIYDFKEGERFSHLKLTVDVANDIVHYGSYNLNSRSQYHDLELNFLAKSQSLASHAEGLNQ